MVTPESPETRDPTGTPRLRLLGTTGAAILTLGALSVLGRLTTPQPSAEPGPTSTSTTVELNAPTTTSPVPVLGEPLAFRPISARRDRPISINTINGRAIVFYDGPTGLGAETWIHHGSGMLEPLGTVFGAQYEIQYVVNTWFGLLAVGTSGGNASPMVWSSSDGRNWTEQDLPTGDLAGVNIWSAYASDDLIVISGESTQPDLDRVAAHNRAQTALTLRLGLLFDYFDWHETLDSVEFEAYGPLGIRLGAFDASELGLDSDVHIWARGPNYQGVVWASRDGVSWTMTVGDSQGIMESMFTGLDSHIWGTTFAGDAGFEATADGVTWRRVPSTHRVSQAQRWGDRLIGFDSSSPVLGFPGRVLVSREGVNWRPLVVPPFLNDPGRPPWVIESVSSGQKGLAMVAATQSIHLVEAHEGTEVLLKRDGGLELWLSDYVLVIRDAGGWTVWTNEHGGGRSLSFDTDEGSISFLDPSTGAALLTATAHELRSVYIPPIRESWSSVARNHALLFTVDGLEWIVQDLSELSLNRLETLLVELVGDELLLVTDHPRGAVWWAPVP